MATNLDLATALADANTTHITLGQEIFANVLPGPWQLWTTQINDPTGRVQNNVIANVPEMREWVGARVLKRPRAYTQLITTKKFEATLPVERLLMKRDTTGTVAQMIGDFHRTQSQEYNVRVRAELDGSSGNGPTGYDAVALFNASHPHVNNGSGHSNTGTANLSHANFTAARAAMRNFRKESNEPFGIAPTHMRVGPDLESHAKEILEAKDRVTFTNMTGATTSSAVQNATLMPNVWAGDLDLVVDPQIPKTSGQEYYWDLYDLSKPVKPMGLLVERPIEAIGITDMDSEERFHNDRFLFGLEGEHAAFAGFWMTAYRNKGTAVGQ